MHRGPALPSGAKINNDAAASSAVKQDLMCPPRFGVRRSSRECVSLGTASASGTLGSSEAVRHADPGAVDRTGFEPVTSSVPRKRATNCANSPYAPSGAANTFERSQARRGRWVFREPGEAGARILHNMKTYEIGVRAEGCVLAALIKSEYTVLIPFGGTQRYDLVVDMGNGFKTVQCKSGVLRRGAIRFRVDSSGPARPRKAYGDEVDFFGVYCAENDETYLVPSSEMGTAMGVLRVEASRNNQVKGVRLAERYRLQQPLPAAGGEPKCCESPVAIETSLVK